MFNIFSYAVCAMISGDLRMAESELFDTICHQNDRSLIETNPVLSYQCR